MIRVTSAIFSAVAWVMEGNSLGIRYKKVKMVLYERGAHYHYGVKLATKKGAVMPPFCSGLPSGVYG